MATHSDPRPDPTPHHVGALGAVGHISTVGTLGAERSTRARFAISAGVAIGAGVAFLLTGSGERLLDAAVSAPNAARFVMAVLVSLLIGAFALLGITSDVVEHTLEREAVTDTLTGLPLAPLLPELLDARCAKASPAGGAVAVCLVDLERFDEINQTFGRECGDLVLAAIAERLRGCLGPDSDVVRCGGDEFALLFSGVRSANGADLGADCATRILESLSTAVEIESFSVAVDANVGVTVAVPGTRVDVDAVIAEAETALYRARRSDIHRFEVHDAHSADREVSPATIVSWLRATVENVQLQLRYQPIWSLADDSLLGVEALLRWDHPTSGPLPPAVVLPALEDSGLIVGVGNWSIDEAVRRSASWPSPAATPMTFINVSLRHLVDSRFVDTIERAIDRTGASPTSLCLELHGSMPGHVWVRLAPTLRECRALGIRLALDGFGREDSDLDVLRREQFDYLKLDRRLIGGWPTTTTADDVIAAAVVEMAHELDVLTIATGVENIAGADRARQLGCGFAQGHLLGSEVTPERAVELMASNAVAPRTYAESQVAH